MKNCKANKFSKTHNCSQCFNLLQVYPSASPFVFSFLVSLSLVTVPTVSWILINYAFFLLSWAQLFEGRLALHPGLNLTQLSFPLLKSIFSDNFLCYPIINLLTERINLNLLFKPSNLTSNFALTLGYLNPALNKTALVFNTKV